MLVIGISMTVGVGAGLTVYTGREGRIYHDGDDTQFIITDQQQKREEEEGGEGLTGGRIIK